MKPILNLDELDQFQKHGQGTFQAKFGIVSEQIGASLLGYNVTIVPQNKKACPFHNHQVNEEMFLILSGKGLLRFGETEYPVRTHDIIACPPGGREVAHQLINTGTSALKYLAISTRVPYEICEYPDSDKILSMVGDYRNKKLRHIARAGDSLDYFDGEE